MGGGDKGLRLLAGRPILEHVCARLGPQCGALAISANGDPARFAAFGLPVLPDAGPDLLGPLAGILAALEWAASLGAPRVLTVASDTPFLPATLASRLSAVPAAAVAATDGPEGIRLHPVCGLWPVSLADMLHSMLAAGERRAGALASLSNAEVISFKTSYCDPFFNVNSPPDLALAETLCAGFA
jgi:molybdopterin-guanine dinucleotide biosynthesis protein A